MNFDDAGDDLKINLSEDTDDEELMEPPDNDFGLDEEDPDTDS